MKKISKATIEQLKAIEPDTLVAHGIISEAPNHKGNYGYVCLLWTRRRRRLFRRR